MKYCKPNLFIVGAAKSGTSSLADYLGQHPAVYMCPIKEPFYFVKDQGIDNENEYISLFNCRDDEKVIAEASTGYLFEDETPGRIYEFNRYSKIIIILRNPVNMAFSYWKYMKVGGNENKLFEDAISENERNYRMTEAFSATCVNWPKSYLYIERAKYYQQVKRYIDVFGRDNVKVMIFEHFVKNIEESLKEIFKFIGVDDGFQPKVAVKNKGGVPRSTWIRDHVYHRKYPFLRRMLPAKWREIIRFFVRDLNRKKDTENLSEATRMALMKEFSCDIVELERLLGLEITEWK